jgi:hypothetical protein
MISTNFTFTFIYIKSCKAAQPGVVGFIYFLYISTRNIWNITERRLERACERKDPCAAPLMPLMI